MIKQLKSFLLLFFFSMITNYAFGQVDTNNITNKDIQLEAIQIREKINNFMNERLLLHDFNSLNEDNLDNQDDKLNLMQCNLDSFLSIVNHQNFQIDSLILNLKLLESFIDLNSDFYNNDFTKNNMNVFNLKSEQFYKFNKIDSVAIMFDKNVFKLNYVAMLTLDSILPFLQKNNILLIGYYYKKEINNDYAVKLRVKDIMLYLSSKGIKRSQISAEFIKENDKRASNLTNKVCILFGK
jgi:hypothetical protein